MSTNDPGENNNLKSLNKEHTLIAQQINMTHGHMNAQCKCYTLRPEVTELYRHTNRIDTQLVPMNLCQLVPVIHTVIFLPLNTTLITVPSIPHQAVLSFFSR